MKGALDIHRDLLSRDVPHEIIRLRRSVMQADELPEALGVDADQCVSVRLYLAGGQIVAAAVPAGCEPGEAALMRAAGARTLRPATSGEVNEATDYAAGLVAPLLLPPDLPLFLDAAISLQDVLYTATGDPGTALGIPTADLLASSAALVADLTSPSRGDSLHLAVQVEV